MEYIEEAQENGIEELAVMEPGIKFIECEPLYREVRSTHPKQDAWYRREAKISLQEYLDFVQEMKQKELPITVRFGLCMDYLPQHEAFLKDLKQQAGLDLFTGRVYFIDNLVFSWNPDSFEMMWDKYHASYLVRKYYEQVHALITSGIFDGLADFELIHALNVSYYFSLNRTYQKLARLLALHHMYVEADTSYLYRRKKNSINLTDAFINCCESMKVPCVPVSNARHPIEVGLYFNTYFKED